MKVSRRLPATGFGQPLKIRSRGLALRSEGRVLWPRQNYSKSAFSGAAGDWTSRI